MQLIGEYESITIEMIKQIEEKGKLKDAMIRFQYVNYIKTHTDLSR